MTTAREDTARLSDLLRREHGALAEFLVAVATFDRERRWVELGYPSLFAFLTRELRLSAGAAQYRKTAAELIQRFPAVEAALRRGDLCLTSVNEVAKVITAENAAEVLPRFFGKSARDAAFIAASIRPVQNPPARAFLVTPLRGAPGSPVPAALTPGVFRAPEVTPVPDTAASALSLDAATDPARPGHGESQPRLAATESAPCSPGSVSPLDVPPASVPPRSASAPPAITSQAAALAPERPNIRPLDAERVRVSMTVSRRLLEKLAAARDALSHSHPHASEEAILELGLNLIIERHRKRRGIGAKPRKPTRAPEAPAAIEAPVSSSSSSSSSPQPSPANPVPVPVPPPAARNRHVPAAVWRGVWARDDGRCAWPLENGGVCGSTHRLQLDHVEGFARGAATTIDGCRLLCAFHQDVSARELYGDAVMNDFTRPKHRDRCSEPVAWYGPA